jgi:hypothetical protein
MFLDHVNIFNFYMRFPCYQVRSHRNVGCKAHCMHCTRCLVCIEGTVAQAFFSFTLLGL